MKPITDDQTLEIVVGESNGFQYFGCKHQTTGLCWECSVIAVSQLRSAMIDNLRLTDSLTEIDAAIQRTGRDITEIDMNRILDALDNWGEE